MAAVAATVAVVVMKARLPLPSLPFPLSFFGVLFAYVKGIVPCLQLSMQSMHATQRL